MPFYLSHPDDRDRILIEGIEADEEGCIDVFSDDMIANTIARDQCGLDSYSLFWLSTKGISAALEMDMARGVTAAYQFRVRQSRIDQQFVRLMGEMEVVKDRATAWDYLFWSRQGFRMPDVNDQFRILNEFHAGRISLEETNHRLAQLTARVNSRLARGARTGGWLLAREASPAAR